MNVLPPRFLVLALLLGASCQATPAALAKKELAPVPASLADRLPADTILFFSLPDIPAMRANMEKSALVKVYRDPEVQNFIAGGMSMLDEAWDELREQAVAQGIPLELTHWEALRSFEAGFALRAQTNSGNPFERPPEVHALARLGLAPGLGQRAYQVLTGHMLGEGQGSEVESTPDRRVFSVMNETEEGMPLTLTVAGLDDAIELDFTWGKAGAGRLADTEPFRRAWNRGVVPGTAMFGYLHLSDVMSTLALGLRSEQPAVADLVDEFFQRVLKPMDAVSIASGWNDSGSFTSASLDFVASEVPDPLWVTQPLDATLADYVPASASAFSIASGRSGPWMDLVMRTMDKVGAFRPENLPLSLGELLQGQLPEVHSWLFGAHRPELDRAINSFGTRSFSYTTPTGGFSTESFTFVELKDPEGMSAVLEQLMPRLREALKSGDSPVKLDMRRTKRSVTLPDGSASEVAGPAYYWLEFEMPPQLQQMLGFLGQTFQPCFGVAPEGWLVVSINVQSVRNVLKSGMQKPEESIRSNEEARAFLARLPKNAHAAAWSDPRPAIGAAMGMVGGLLPMLSGMLGDKAAQLPVDLHAFPSADAFVRHMRTSESYSYEWLGDMRSVSVGSFGLADLFTAVGAAAALVPPFLAIASEVFEGVELAQPAAEAGEVAFYEKT